jgi:hypothetical protein
MADTIGQVDIRGIEVQKFVTGFADEDVVLKKFCRQATATSREIRWFQKTAGYISPATTTGITSNLLANTAEGAIAPVAYQSWTRNTSNVRKYFVESELITMEDEADSDVDVLGTMIRDLLIGVSSQVDVRIYNVLTESLSPVNILSTAATADGWDDAATGNPILDILTGNQKIRAQRFKIDASNKAVLYINSIEHRNLLNYLISVKGSSIPSVSGALLKEAVVMEILNNDVVVSENATTDYALQFLPNKSVAWKSFIGLTSEVEKYAGKGKKIFVWEEGEALLEYPKSVHLITDTVV